MAIGAGPRLWWAGAGSAIVHAALLWAPATTSPSAGPPVVALIVRTIAAGADAAGPTSSAGDSVNESRAHDASAGSLEQPAPGVRPRSDDAKSAMPTRAPGVMPERAPGAAARAGVAGNSASRDAGPPARAPAALYHLAGELDPPPRPLDDIEPVYPPEAGFQPGAVVLRLYIDESGTVERVDVLQANPPGLFENAARTAFAAARFSPGRIAGIAVKCQLTIEVEFTPINRGSDVSGRTY
ncbi:MAG TPA: TonB family protein [Caldimonas sp.]|nr:TonB family protein [Caldimonas sp.]